MKKILTLFLALLSLSCWAQIDTVITVDDKEYSLKEVYVGDYKGIKTFRGDSISLTVSKNHKEGILYRGGNLYKVRGNSTVDYLVDFTEHLCKELVAEEISQAVEDCDPNTVEYLTVDHYIVSDYSMFVEFGEAALILRNISLLNDISLIYETEFDIPVTFNLVGQIIYQSEASDPFTEDMSLDEMIKRSVGLYNNTGADNTTVWTHRDFPGSVVGLGYLNSLCSSSFSKNVCQNLNNDLNNIVLYAHEIGHNFGFTHDNSVINIMFSSLQTTSDFSEKSEGEFNAALANNRYSCAAVCGTLPITLEYFTANLETIDFKTISETNVSHFVVEGSFEGVDFTGLREVSANNAPTTYSIPNRYEHTYFRLVSYDFDGYTQYSDLAYVYRESKPLLIPNPLPSTLHNQNGDIIMIYDILGNLIIKSNSHINLENLSSGSYIINNKVYVKL